MLTPKELSAQKFDKVLMWGYDMTAVDSFLERVEADYTALYQENISLTEQLKALSDKSEERRENAEAADVPVPETKPSDDTVIMRPAEEVDRDALLRELAHLTEQVAAEKRRLAEARSAARAYIDHILSRYASEEKYLSSLRDSDPEPPARPSVSSSEPFDGSESRGYDDSEPTIVTSAPRESVSDSTRTFPPFDLNPIHADTAEKAPAEDSASEAFPAEDSAGLSEVPPLPKSEEFLNPFWEDLWDTDPEAPKSDDSSSDSGEFTEDLSDEITLPTFSMSASPRSTPSPSSPASKPRFEFSRLSLSDFIQRFGNNK